MEGRRWVWWPIGAAVISLLLPIATFLVAAVLLGYHLVDVRSGSMEPAYPVGSMLVVKPVDVDGVGSGAVIVVARPDGDLQAHRVVEALDRPDGRFFRTRGDANRTPDADLVAAKAVRGRVLWHVPQLGRVTRWLAWPRGFLLLVLVPAGILVATEVGARRRNRNHAEVNITVPIA